MSAPVSIVTFLSTCLGVGGGHADSVVYGVAYPTSIINIYSVVTYNKETNGTTKMNLGASEIQQHFLVSEKLDAQVIS
jgi:hypothetical protein